MTSQFTVDELMTRLWIEQGQINTFYNRISIYQPIIDAGFISVHNLTGGKYTMELKITELGKEYMRTLGAI